MLNKIPACRVRTIIIWILRRRATEQPLPAPITMKCVGVLHPVAGLLAKNAHPLRVRAAFDVDDHLALEPHQPRMREIERDGDAGRVLRAEPFGRQPDMRDRKSTRLNSSH